MLNLALASPLLAAFPTVGPPLRGEANGLDLRLIKNAPGAVVPVADTSTVKQVKLVREWNGPLCRSRLINNGRQSVRVKEVVLFDLAVPLPPATRLYGEGFQMLSQTGGTLGQAIDLGNYTDAKHYKMPIPADARCFYGMMSLSPPAGEHYLLAFTSCRRFIGQFYLRASRLQIVVDTEGLDLKPGETLELEEFMFMSGAHRGQLLEQLAGRLIENHPPLRFKTPPAGWCSWYCFGPRVTATQVLDNLASVIRERFKILRQVRVFTAQGRMTLYILMALAPGFALIIFFANPKYLSPLWTDPMGRRWLVYAAILQVIGLMLTRKIIRIKI